MKIYLLTYCENNDDNVAANADAFSTHQEAQDAMKKEYDYRREVVGQTAPGFVEDDEHCHDINEWGAGVIDGYDSYNWTITEKELPVKVAVVLYGGFVEGIYTTAESLDAEVIDLDSDENKEGQKAVDAIEKDPAWLRV